MTFSRGEGLPGKTWEMRKPFILHELSAATNFQRRDSAGKAGLQSAFGFPLLLGGEVSGIIECFSVEPLEPDSVFVESWNQLVDNSGSSSKGSAQKRD